MQDLHIVIESNGIYNPLWHYLVKVERVPVLQSYVITPGEKERQKKQ